MNCERHGSDDRDWTAVRRSFHRHTAPSRSGNRPDGIEIVGETIHWKLAQNLEPSTIIRQDVYITSYSIWLQVRAYGHYTILNPYTLSKEFIGAQ